MMLMLITAQKPGPRKAESSRVGRAGATVPTPGERQTPPLASVGPKQKQLFNSFAAGRSSLEPSAAQTRPRLAIAPSPCWRSWWSYHGSSSFISNSSTRFSASISAGSSGGSGPRRRRPASAAAPGSPPAPPHSARAALWRDPPPPPKFRSAARPQPPAAAAAAGRPAAHPADQLPDSPRAAQRHQRPAPRRDRLSRRSKLVPHAAAGPNVALRQNPPRPGLRFKPPAAPRPIVSGPPAERRRRRPIASHHRPAVRPGSRASSQWRLRRKQRRREKEKGCGRRPRPSSALSHVWACVRVAGV